MGALSGLTRVDGADHAIAGTWRAVGSQGPHRLGNGVAYFAVVRGIALAVGKARTADKAVRSVDASRLAHVAGSTDADQASSALLAGGAGWQGCPSGRGLRWRAAPAAFGLGRAARPTRPSDQAQVGRKRVRTATAATGVRGATEAIVRASRAIGLRGVNASARGAAVHRAVEPVVTRHRRAGHTRASRTSVVDRAGVVVATADAVGERHRVTLAGGGVQRHCLARGSWTCLARDRIVTGLGIRGSDDVRRSFASRGVVRSRCAVCCSTAGKRGSE